MECSIGAWWGVNGVGLSEASQKWSVLVQMVPDGGVSIHCHRTDTHQRFDASMILADDGSQSQSLICGVVTATWTVVADWVASLRGDLNIEADQVVNCEDDCILLKVSNDRGLC